METLKEFICTHIDGYDTVVEVYEEGTMVKIICSVCGSVMNYYFIPKER